MVAASNRHLRRRAIQALGRMLNATSILLLVGSHEQRAPTTNGNVGPRLPYFATLRS
jgi:hypothetical protein